jgi:hypothetical protein
LPVNLFYLNNFLAGAAGGVSYNVGSLYGAGFFVCSFVVSMVIMVNKNGEPVVVSERIIYRDVGFYIIATVTTIIFAYTGFIFW